MSSDFSDDRIAVRSGNRRGFSNPDLAVSSQIIMRRRSQKTLDMLSLKGIFT